MTNLVFAGNPLNLPSGMKNKDPNLATTFIQRTEVRLVALHGSTCRRQHLGTLIQTESSAGRHPEDETKVRATNRGEHIGDI